MTKQDKFFEGYKPDFLSAYGDKQVRDWHKDKLDNLVKRCEIAKGYGETICVDPDAVISLIERADKLQMQLDAVSGLCRAETKRADRWREHVLKLNSEIASSEAREKKLREAIEAMKPGMWDGMRAHFEVVLASLYKEEESK
ncbi:hypothetical protein D1872_203660 [compost metagenome]